MRIDTLLLTILMELIVYIIVIRSPFRNLLLYVVIINIITQPIAQYLFRIYYSSPLYDAYGFYTAFLVIEVLVIFSETYLIAGLFKEERRKSFRISLLANSISAFSGLIIYSFL